MSLTDIIARSGRNLRSAKIRTLLTALAIGVGGFTLTLTLGAGNGLRHYTDKLVADNFNPAEMIVGRDSEIGNQGAPSDQPQEYDESVSSVDFGGGGAGTTQLKQVTQQDINELRALPYIQEVRENYTVNLRYITRDAQKRYTVTGQVYNPSQKPELSAGSLPVNDLDKGTAVLPEAYVDLLGFDSPQDAIGKTVQVTAEKSFTASDAQGLLDRLQSGADIAGATKPEQKTMTLTIAGISKKPATSFAFGQLPLSISNADGRELYDFTTKGTADYQKYLVVYAQVKDGTNEAKLQQAKQQLEAKGYTVQTAKDVQQSITQFVNILQGMVGVFGLITLVASVFGIVNTQYISVLERTREIGLMKALGMRSRDVRRLFTIEATWIGFLGGLIGTVSGIAVGLALNPWLSRTLDLGEGNSIFIVNPVQNIIMIIVLMIIATLAGLLPAYKASRLDPIVALRHE